MQEIPTLPWRQLASMTRRVRRERGGALKQIIVKAVAAGILNLVILASKDPNPLSLEKQVQAARQMPVEGGIKRGNS